MSVPEGLRLFHLRPGDPDFLDLPWNLPLAAWPGASPRVVEMPRGLSRHDVVFVAYERRVYALKELPIAIGEREYGLLRELEERGLPAVTPVGHAHRRADGALEETGVLLTRFLEASVPYRTLFMQQGLERYRERLLDAMAVLLVRLHLAGYVWGDCSLSNTLFRRDAGELTAYLVDAETSELHDTISEGRRVYDLDVMEENVAGELADLSHLVALPPALSIDGTGAQIRERYAQLWEEITREVLLKPDERFRIHERIRALNDLGFTVGELELLPAADGEHLRLRTFVTDRDHHRHLLHSMTGVVAGDRQAQQFLNEIHEMQATLSRSKNRSVPLSEAAFAWLKERFEPTVERVRPARGPGADAAETYSEVLEHKWFRSEQAQQDVGLEQAIADYLERFHSAG